MSGLEKIIGTISEEAHEKAASMIGKAKEEAGKIVTESEKRTLADAGRITAKAQSEVKNIRERSKASAELKKKQILLSGKQELISETVEKAKGYMDSLSDAEYIRAVQAVFAKHVPKEDAVLMLNARDQKRLPANMIAGFVQAAAENGAKLTVSVQNADIRDGFILDYGGIWENCSFEALIDQNIEEIEDSINKKLFA